MNENFQHDFNVKIISECQDSFLMAGVRDTHYHFLLNQNGLISQYHIPKFQIANVFEMMHRFEWDVNVKGHPVTADILGGFNLSKFSKVRYAILLGSDYYHLDNPDAGFLFKEIKKDVARFRKAKKLVKYKSDKYYLKDLKTLKGSPIESSKDFLIEKIAFEILLFEELKIKPSFSLYTIYSQLIDGTNNLNKSFFAKIANSINFYRQADLSNEIRNIFKKVQKDYFSTPVFGNNVIFKDEEVQSELEKALNQLTPAQKVQFEVLEPVYIFGFLLSLAFIHRQISLFQFNYLVNSCFQPDSKQEQNNRYETSVVAIFGDCFRYSND